MLKRILTGVILIIMLAGFALGGYFVSPIFVDMLVLIFMAGSVYEMFRCFSKAGYKMFKLPSIFVLLTAYPTFYLMQYYIGGKISSAGVQGLMIVFLIAAMMCLTIFTFLPAEKEGAYIVDAERDGAADDDAVAKTESAACKRACGLKDLLANMFIIVYPMLFFSAAWVLSYKYSALFAVMFAIFVPVVGADMFAYFFGSFIGGKKLCPAISPKKTIAGGVGALIGGMVFAIVFWAIFEIGGDASPQFAQGCGYVPFIAHAISGWQWKSAMIYLALGLICGVVSELGDLAASRIKRAIGIKDYGAIFPGHGGFMDRIDSVLYCLVVLLIAFTVIYGY